MADDRNARPAGITSEELRSAIEEFCSDIRRMREELNRELEESGKRLLHAFLAIAIPNEIRMTQAENELASIKRRLITAETRLSDVETRVTSRE